MKVSLIGRSRAASASKTQGNYYGTGFRLPLLGLVGPGMVYFALDLLKCRRPDMFSPAELILYPLNVGGGEGGGG